MWASVDSSHFGTLFVSVVYLSFFHSQEGVAGEQLLLGHHNAGTRLINALLFHREARFRQAAVLFLFLLLEVDLRVHGHARTVAQTLALTNEARRPRILLVVVKRVRVAGLSAESGSGHKFYN